MSEKSILLDVFKLGVCYYPEHWDEALWADDFRRMKEMKFSVIRIAEFAWSIFEPEEGVFQFGFFDRVLDLAHEYGLEIILCTPTATPPAWLTYKYPEVLNVSLEGVTYQHGQRRHYNYSSPIYRSLCARITKEMAEHYKNHPTVVGWQLDNEFNCETNVFYSEADHAAFRIWIQMKYGTLEQLNYAWGAVFWNQTYSAWEQVHLTRPTPSDSANPHQALDEKRFISDNVISFAKIQADIIRETSPNHWVTTNGVFGHLDSHRLTDELLDFISYDSYPLFALGNNPSTEANPLQDRGWSKSLSNVRSISPHFCAMEQQSGPGSWVNRIELPSPRPGQMRLWAYQSIAHGADMLLFFRWRTATVGTEIYWHGINDYHNQPNRRVAEATRIGHELANVGKHIVGSSFVAEVALIRDYDNEWDGELDSWHGPMEQHSLSGWFKALQHRHIPLNILNMTPQTALEELIQYKLLVYPHPTILSDECAKLLEAYVEQGGQIVFGCRTGYKNIHGHCNMRVFPGPIADLCGITVEDFTLIKGAYQAPPLRWLDQEAASAVTADLFNDIIHVESPSVEVIAEYAAEYYVGKPALTVNKFGQGSAWYYGASFNDQVAAEIITRIGLLSSVEAICTVPLQVETVIRQSVDERLIFFLNYSNKPEKIDFKQDVFELLTEETLRGIVEIEAFGVMLVR